MSFPYSALDELMNSPMDKLLRRVAAHLKRHKMNVTEFGKKAANNSTLIRRLESGNVTARTIARVESYLAKAKKRHKAKRLTAKR